MLKQNYRMLAIIFAIVLTLACAPIAVATPPAAAPLPTLDLLLINTTIAQTAGAAATQTSIHLPTFTPSPTATKTPTEVPSSTPTFLFLLATPTVPSSTPTVNVSSGGPYLCQVVSQTPGDNSAFSVGASFDAHWLVLNAGTAAWDANSADYRYVSGDQFYKQPAYDFSKTVEPGASFDFVVAMQAPNKPGTYTTTWKIALGKERFCPMNMTIVVR